MYCRSCKYELWGVGHPRCPECGTAFDPADPRTWLRDRDERWREELKLVGVVLAVVAAMLVTVAILLLALFTLANPTSVLLLSTLDSRLSTPQAPPSPSASSS